MTQRRIAKKMDSELEKKKKEEKTEKRIIAKQRKKMNKRNKKQKAERQKNLLNILPLIPSLVFMCVFVLPLRICRLSVLYIFLFLFLGFSFICASSILLIIINHHKPFPPTPYIQPRSHLQPYSNIHKALKIR